ncbi:MAG: hypothetical protein WBS22_08105 [Methylocystis sp.]
MNIMKKTLLASAVSAAALLAASAASAADYTISNVGFTGETLSWSNTPPGATESSGLAGLITLTTTTGQILPTFCVDLFHNISIGGSGYQYNRGVLTNDAAVPTPNTLTSTQVGEIYALADIGVQQYLSHTGTMDTYAAVQAGIWTVEYGITGVTGLSDPSLLTTYLAEAEAHPLDSSLPWGLLPLNGSQQLVTAPGPNVGEGLLGFAAMTALLIGARYRGLFV